MDERLRTEIAAIAADARSGATALLARALVVLREAANNRETLDRAAEALCRAQPGMAGLRVAAAVASRASDPAAALEAFAARTARAPGAIARHAVALLKLRRRSGPLRIVTCSRSHIVERTIRALAADTAVDVCCAEGRPALEGRDLAASLAQAGIPVTLYTDAGIGAAIPSAEAFLAGADAIGPDAFINKVGTGALAALGAAEGIPTYVLAGREKVVPVHVFNELALSGGATSDVWRDAPPGVRPANPYFERIRNSVVSGFVLDVGVIDPGGIAELSVI